MISNTFNLNMAVLQSSLKTAELRNDVINHNIANVDTPGFKQKHVVFESFLQNALQSGNTKDILNIQPLVKTKHQNFNYRMDGNNVDIEEQMIMLYENALKHDAIINSVTNNFKRMNLALK